MSNSFAACRWLDSPAAVFLTGDRVLRVEGSGSRRWLNSLLTADLRGPVAGAARYALLLSPTGGIVSDAWVVECGFEEPEKLALVLPAACADLVYRTLDKYLLDERVSMSFDNAVRVVALQGRRGRELLAGPIATLETYPCARLADTGLDVWVPTSQVDGVVARLSATAYPLGGAAIASPDWSFAHVALGVPQAGIDFDENTSPHEAGLDRRAVSFSKGCYLGQEVVARQHRRGGLARRLIQLAIEGAERVGERLAQGSMVRGPSGEEVGRVTSVAFAGDESMNVLALAYLTSSFAQVGTGVTVAERAARVRRIVGRSESATPPGIG